MIIDDETLYKGWLTLRRVKLQMENGVAEERHVEDHGDAVAVLPYDADRGMLLLVSQPRAPVIEAGEADLLEVIAGRIEGEDIEVCARREALEEAGVKLDKLEFLAKIWSMPAISTERLHLYLAPYSLADRVEEGGGAHDENEQIRVHELPIRTVFQLIETGRLTDAKTLLLVLALRHRKGMLFA